MLKITIALISRNAKGRQHKISTSSVIHDASISTLKSLWDAERAINELGTIRCHVNIEEIGPGHPDYEVEHKRG